MKRTRHTPICFSITKNSETADEIAKRTICNCGEKNCKYFKKHLIKSLEALKSHPMNEKIK